MDRVCFGARGFRMALCVILGMLTLGMTGCDDRILTVVPDPVNMKQGDVVSVRLNASDTEHLVRIEYDIGGTAGTVTTVPATVVVSTCKTLTTYPAAFPISCQAVYDDNEVIQYNYTYDLTVGDRDREDNTLTFDVYVAHNGGQHGDVEIDMAARFKDRFDAYALDNYYWAQEYFYTTSALYFANGHDLTLSFGHGRHHVFCYDHWDEVDLSTTQYGNFVPCGHTGDAEYLAFAACEVLKLTDVGDLTFWDFWFPTNDTRYEARPFTGLHMVLGFRTNFAVTAYWWGYWRTHDGKDFVREFANKMDQGWNVRTAWLDSAADELKQKHGKNMAAVLYPIVYDNDTVYTDRDDYIFPNASSMNKIVVYLE